MKQDLGTGDQLSEKSAVSIPPSKKPEKNLYEPYSTPRVLYEALRTFAIIVFSLFTRIRLIGRYNIPRKGPYIIASNHLSWADIPLVPLYVPSKVVYMAKEEAFKGRVGWLVRFLGAFPVKRGEGDRQAIRAASEQLKKGNVFIIFPEGTRSKTHTLAKAHSGLGMIALRSQVPVLPVAIWGSEKAFRTFRPVVTITYGEPLVLKPKGNKVTREDIDGATEAIMQRIAEMLPPQYHGVYAKQQQTETAQEA
jgi:1-acyl-sn-glycerol-3-phosphate acyltransferase